LLFYFIFTTGIREYGIFENLFFGFGGIGYIVCGIGFWFMKKWAVYAYAIFAFIDQIALLMLGRWNFFSLLISIIIVYVGYKHLSKMS